MIRFDSENELEMFLFENQEFMEDSLDLLVGELARQVDFGCYGRLDFLHFAYVPEEIGPCVITVIELKNEKMKSVHMAQLCRYIEAVRRFIDDRFSVNDFEIKGLLVGPKTFPDSSDNCFLFQNMESINCFEFDLSIDGMVFRPVSNWSVTGEFKTKDINTLITGEDEL